MDERELVLDILLDIDKNKAFSNVALSKALKKHQFEDKQKRDYIIDSYSKTKVAKMKPLIRCAMRMGVYQLLYMDSVPDRAAIFETVKLVKKHGFSSLSGFVNAVLRNISREKDAIVIKVSEVPHIKYSVPEWLYDFLVKTYDAETADMILESGSEERPTTIRVNVSKTDKDSLRHMIEEKGINVADGHYAPDALLMDGYDFIKKVPGYRDGLFSVQDESSQMAVRRAYDTYMSLHPEMHLNGNGAENKDNSVGLTVVDLCAAPGGKTTYAAELISGKGAVNSFDISKDKTDLIEENVERLGLSNVTVSVSDATVKRDDLLGMADIVIADVPCSGLGIMGRKNDIKYRVQPEDFEALRNMADSILDNAVSYLKPDGILLFSTCTINPYENGEAAEALMSRHSNLKKIEEKTFLQGVDKCDGFYYCIFQE